MPIRRIAPMAVAITLMMGATSAQAQTDSAAGMLSTVAAYIDAHYSKADEREALKQFARAMELAATTAPSTPQEIQALTAQLARAAVCMAIRFDGADQSRLNQVSDHIVTLTANTEARSRILAMNDQFLAPLLSQTDGIDLDACH